MVVVAYHKVPEVAEPGEQSFNCPATTVPAEFSAILGLRPHPVALVRRNEPNTTSSQLLVEWVGVVRLVPEQSLRLLPGEGVPQGCGNEGTLAG